MFSNYLNLDNIMNNIKAFVVIIASLLMFGCGTITYYSDETNPIVVKIADRSLYLSDLAAFMESQPYGVDSLAVIEAFVSSWVREEMKLNEAEKMFANNQKDIDILVDKYRKSLLIYKYENYYRAQIDTTVLDADIVEYYNANKYQFKLASPVVKVRILIVPNEYKLDPKLLAKLYSSTQDSRHDVFAIAERDKLSFYDFGEDWVYLSAVTRYFPIKNVTYDKYLANTKNDKVSDDEQTYYLSILKYRKSGDDMPLNFVKGDIRKLILNQRRGEVFKAVEDSVYKYMEKNTNIYKINIDSAIVNNIKKLK